MGAIFLMSSSGYVMYKSSCSCTGKAQTSVFIKPETCETSFHQHHTHDADGVEQSCCAETCHECAEHTNDCGCDSPKVFFFKLQNEVTNEEVKFIKTEPVVLEVAKLQVFELLVNSDKVFNTDTDYIDPPPKILTSLDFLIEIQRLKIPTNIA